MNKLVLLLLLAVYQHQQDALFVITETVPNDNPIKTFVRAPVDIQLITDFNTASWLIRYDIDQDGLKAKGTVFSGHSVLNQFRPDPPGADYNLEGYTFEWSFGGYQNDEDQRARSNFERRYVIGGNGFYARLYHGVAQPNKSTPFNIEHISLGTIDIDTNQKLSLGINGLYGGFVDLPAYRPGDFNHDTRVDTKDYVIYRNQGGILAPYLLKENVWRYNYGNDATPITPTAVPEPRTIFQIFLILILLCQTGRERIRDYYRNQSGRVVPIQTIAEIEEIYKNIRTPEQLAEAVHRHREWWLKRLYKMWIAAKKGKGPRAGAPDNVVGSPGYLARMFREQILAWNHPTEPNTLYLSFYPGRYHELGKQLQRYEYAAYDKLRVWNLKDGTKIRAVLGLIEPQAVILIDVPGSQITVRRSKLSNEDKKYVLEQYRSYIK